MPNYIVIRLTPPTAVGAATFTAYLTNLTIKVYDISYSAPTDGTLIGSAAFVAPAFPPAATTHIVQHSTPPLFKLPLTSVATALIQYTPPGPEYVSPDLRIEFDRGAASPVFDTRIYYNVRTVNLAGPFPNPLAMQLIADSAVSVFATLNPVNSPLVVPGDGTPPEFDELLAAVTAVLTKDPALPVNPTLLSKLTIEQCRNIANEIIYGPQAPLPQPPEHLGDMFTNPPNKGGFGDSHEQNRQQFEGQLSGYYGPRDAAALRLANYIYALSTAYWCELQTQAAKDALVTFPVNPNVPSPPLTTVSESQVIFTGALGLDVPAAYFYALTYDLSVHINGSARYKMALGADQQANLNRITRAVSSGWISVPATMNPAQAVRILDALNLSATSTLPKWDVTKPSANQIFKDWVKFPPLAAWKSYKPGDDVDGFWKPEATAHANDFLNLVLFALTQGFMIGANSLADEIKLRLSLPSPPPPPPFTDVTQLAKATPSDWKKFFADVPGKLGVPPEAVLPPFTLPGSVPARIAAFINFVQKFFQMGTATPAVLHTGPVDPLRFGVPANDIVANTVAGFDLKHLIAPAALQAAAAAAAPGDTKTQEWAVQAVETLNELFMLAAGVGPSDAFNFSVMEALYARGFTSHLQVLEHTFEDFQQALTGTIAYEHAKDIQKNASNFPGAPDPPTDPGPGGPFGPINPGCLTDCIPPMHLSPLGPVAYLSEMLQVSELSTCDDPFAAPAPGGHTTLQAQIDERRGPIEKLAVTQANLDTPLPLIDIVNECLEFMASTTPPGRQGTVYDTSEDELAGHKLCDSHCDHGGNHHDCGCKHEDCECKSKEKHDHDDEESPEESRECHKPAVIFDALPEYSTPATPVAQNSAVTPAVWDKLKSDFSTCCLPYDQALDVNRTYLKHFRSCRFEEMRTFRKCITELVLDPVNQPADFQSHLWRYPVRLDIAIEYLGFSPEEYTTLFDAEMPPACAEGPRNPPGDIAPAPGQELKSLRFADTDTEEQPPSDIPLPEFLKFTCLTYCEFIDLWKSEFILFENGADRQGRFPECEPCCLDDLEIRFPGETFRRDFEKLNVFVRLWHKLRHLCGARYNFIQLADICTVLDLSSPDFIRRLAAFQMLRDQFRLKLTGEKKPDPGATGADRTYLLSLWAGPGAAHWQWAVSHLLAGIAFHAECHHKCERRAPEFIKLLEENLDPLSRLAGFDPGSPGDTWQASPTHTLRFAEILAKIYASNFSIGEILFLFTADIHLDGDDPFPLQDPHEANDSPLGLPEDDHKHSLWHLRRKLLDVHVPEKEADEWGWRAIEASLVREFGFPSGEVIQLGEHFFPHTLGDAGHPVTPAARRFTGNLAVTAPQMWNSPPEGPFHYDVGAKQLWAVLPVRDKDVLEQLRHVQQLDPAEQQAVQDVYFQPRLILSSFALLFENFAEAEHRLIEEEHEHERWRYVQRQFAKMRARAKVLAHHLSEHVEAVTGQERPENEQAAHVILKDLYADENATTAASWEDDNGTVPPVIWTPPANGGAFAALLGLTGTGLAGEFTIHHGPVIWREVREAMRSFGLERDRENCPVPTVIPFMGLTLTPEQMKYVTVCNGLAMADAKGTWLGGAQGFTAKWSGVLFIDEEGEYHFRAGAPTEGEEEARPHEARHRSWRVLLKRGQKTWVLLRHHWNEEEELEPAAIHLRSGAYEFNVEFIQHSPEYLHEDEIHRQHTGFEIQYRGPDTGGELAAISHEHLFRIRKDGPIAVNGLTGTAADFLHNRYTSTLRDMRRTYQRAFKAMLFTHRFRLSARPHAAEGSELAYLLSQPDKFAGWSYYRKAGVFTSHRADFDFNLLPVSDDYLSPAADKRAAPSSQRMQALFDWWERIFDYTRVRKYVHAQCDRHLWLLFEEAYEKKPPDPKSLLRHMCADARHWALDLHFFQGQAAPIYAVQSADLEDERWTVRAWQADLWLDRLWRHFTVKNITEARPDLWASDNPTALVGLETVTGNENLLEFLCAGCFENGDPRRYSDVRQLNDELRERGRNALISYLCGPGGIAKSPNELSEILLLDVLAGRCERASRIEGAISAVQTFVRRARLGLEPGWTVSHDFAHLWDCRFTNFRVWQACKRRELYKENWIDWDEFGKAEKIEAFRLLTEQLKRATLTVAEPGGVDYWPDRLPPGHPGLCLLQRKEPAEMQILPAAREGLNLLATPERDARPSWITTVPDSASTPVNPDGGNQLPALKAALAPPSGSSEKLPFWMECAIRLGTRFLRVAAAEYPPASTEFEARHECKGKNATDSQNGNDRNKDKNNDKECCVSCCCKCGCEHPACMDEYYFWLIDAQYFDPETQSVYSGIFDGQQNEYYDQNAQVATPWHDPSTLPDLLKWPSEPMVRLAWCRVHNGEFQQPRRSDWGIAYDPKNGIPDLDFAGRVGDSLYLELTPATAGFRYDIVPDTAEQFDNLTVPAAAPSPAPPAKLVAYPYFVYFEPGARLFPWSMYAPAMAVACALRTNCRFEAALKWYELPYNPLEQDNRWALCKAPGGDGNGNNLGQIDSEFGNVAVADDPGCCCDSTDITCQDARNRSVLLNYLETLLQWGDSLLCRNSAEAFQQARLVFDTMRKIMGGHPGVVKNATAVSQTVAGFSPLLPSLNPRLMTLFDQLDERFSRVHECMSPRRLKEMYCRSEGEYWGDDPVRHCWQDPGSSCCEPDGCCRPCTPYRFSFRIQRAKELAAQTRELGSALLAAFEKGDSEFLASIRARQERELAVLNQKVREDQWRDADWQVQALEKSKQSQQASRRYYAQLIANGLVAHENAYLDMTNVSMDDRTAANITEGIAEVMDLIPDIFVGTSDFTWLPLGTKLSGLFKTISRITNTVADIASSTASLDLTEGGWDRRLQDWVEKVTELDIQTEQTELQKLGAERRRNQALLELNIQQRTIEQATEMLNFLRDKFTNHAFYLFLQKQTADLYRMMYELACNEAHEAERVFHFERGHTAGKIIRCGHWENLHEGLLAGEKLQLDLARMEKEYIDHNCREYELTKHISLRLAFPLEFLRLKLTGRCEVEVPEWMFDLDYPGHYMRRIRNVSLTIPCVAGPYNEVHCRLTLLRSGTRINPLLKAPAALCCDCCQSGNGYPVCSHDPRWVSENGALEAIATSSGQNDAGLFEVNFRDDRYLPFEYHGAVSRWRVELPPENNFFDLESLSDVVLHLNYTAREGGEKLRRKATETVECDLPGAGWCLFDLRHDFSDAWELFRQQLCGHEDERHKPHLDLRFTRNMFPFVPCKGELFIDKMALLFDHPENCGCKCPGECPCCADPTRAHHELELKHRGEDERRFRCLASRDWPGLCHGSVEGICIGPLFDRRERELVKMIFPHTVETIENAYLLCRYTLRDRCCSCKEVHETALGCNPKA